MSRYAIATLPAMTGAAASTGSGGVLDPHGPIAAAERLILINATGIMLVVVVPVIVMTLAFAWWYRASNSKAAYRPEWSYSGYIELVVWAVPALVVILLGAVGWIGAHELDPAKRIVSDAKPIRVEVVALDWKWLFIYPDAGVAAVNKLVVPVGTPIEFQLTSANVMNAFFVPQLGSQVYAMPGMTSRLNLLADRAGEYPGFSSHYSGEGFSGMRFVVQAVAPAEFERWLASTRADGPALDPPAYARLKQPSQAVPPQTWRTVDPALFERIVGTAGPMCAAPRWDAGT